MTPFQEFRFWIRRAPINERIAAGFATVIVLGLLIWVIVPSGNGPTTSGFGLSNNPSGSTSSSGGTSSSGSTGTSGSGGSQGLSSGGTGAGGSGATGSGGSTGTGSAALGTGGGSGASGSGGSTTTGSGSRSNATGTGSHGCVSPPGSATGISGNQMKIAVILTDIAGPVADSTFNVADPRLAQAAYQAAIDQVNASGGIACRKVVPTYYKANPVDQSNLQSVCLSIAQAGDYAVIDSGAYAQSTAETCYAQHHIAYFTAYLMQDSLRKRFYPYFFAAATFDQVYHDTVFGLKAKGFFSPSRGFKKLGVLYRTCFPDEVTNEFNWLHQAGVPDSQIVKFNVGCPSALASPSSIEQAVLTFQRQHVTNVTYFQFVADFASFTRQAQQQRYHPKYGLPDDELVTLSYGQATRPNPQNLNGAMAIANARDGEEKTAGATPTAGTKQCDAALKKAGLAPTYRQPYGVGNACDQVSMLEAAVDHAPSIQTNALAIGLQRAKSIDWSFPFGPNDFSGNGTTTGGQYYRYIGYTTACNCWRVTDPTFRRSTY